MADDEMSSLYGDGDQGAKDQPQGSVDKQDEKEDANTAVVPAKVLQEADGDELKEGDTITVRVVANYGDEVEIARAEDKTPEEPAGAEAAPEDELDTLSKES